MRVGSFMGKTFRVDTRKIFTVDNLKGSTGSEWSQHHRYVQKARSQYISPKLKSYSFDILLRAQDGVPPRRTLEFFQRCSENGKADYFVIGGRPLSNNRFYIKDISDAWDATIKGGKLVSCKISLTIEEYV